MPQLVQTTLHFRSTTLDAPQMSQVIAGGSGVFADTQNTFTLM